MFGLFAQKGLNIGLDRRFLVLTKSDKWFGSCAPENLPERIKARMEECDRMEGWQGVKPLVVGYTHKLDENHPGLRTQQYKDANRAEDTQLADLRRQVGRSQSDLHDFWPRCGFSKVQPMIEQRCLEMDKSLVVNMINQLSRHEARALLQVSPKRLGVCFSHRVWGRQVMNMSFRESLTWIVGQPLFPVWIAT